MPHTASSEALGTCLTPAQIVAELDRHIVGQVDAKRSAAIALRNRWRRQQLPTNLRDEVAPKNILMIGPTGVGKTEIARRMAQLTNAPFVKVEATKYTEVGYYGRDVESMVRELVENAIVLVRQRVGQEHHAEAAARAEERLLDLLVPPPLSLDVGGGDQDTAEHYERCREQMRQRLATGELENRRVEVPMEQKSNAVMLGGSGQEPIDLNVQGMLEKFLPKYSVRREMTVSEARRVLFEQACELLLDPNTLYASAIELAENAGVIFIDEIDKVVASEAKGTDVSRQGVQRDLLPIVEGTSVQTRYGAIRTHQILFIGAGAFHRCQPSDLMPELQGRFPIRVELQDLNKDDFVRILTEPNNALTRQYRAMMATEGVELSFTDDAIQAIAHYAYQVNQTTQNIGARRLYTILERLLEELSFYASDGSTRTQVVDEAYVHARLQSAADDKLLRSYIL